MPQLFQERRLRGSKLFLCLGLFFLVVGCLAIGRSTPTLAVSSPLPPSATVEQPSPIPPSATFEPPVGFVEYQDIVACISIYIPGDWVITEIIEGQYAIFQSYPLDKYIGGEGFQPGDSKCDLNLRLEAASPEDLLEQWTSDGLSEIVSKEQVTLASGIPGLRVELEGWGGSLSMFTEINSRIIALTCYGERAHFDSIAATLRSLD